MFKKQIVCFIILLLCLTSCINNQHRNKKNKKIDDELIKTGYFVDIATMSEIEMVNSLSRIENIKKPEYQGFVSIPNLKNIVITTNKIEEVNDKDIEAYIEEERDNYAYYRKVEEKREARYGDKIIIDYLSQVSGEKANFENIQGFELVLEEGLYHKDFIDTIVAHVPGDMFNFTIYYPDDYFLEKYRGKKILHKVMIKEIYEYYTPSFNQSFIASYSEIKAKDVDEYKKIIRDKLQFKKEYYSNKDIHDKLLYYLVENVSIDVDNEFLAYEYAKLILEQKNLAENLSIDFIDYIHRDYQSVEQFITHYKIISEYEAIKDIVLDELTRRYNISVNDEDMKQWFDTIYKINEFKNTDYDKYLDKVGYDYVYENTRVEKIMSSLIKYINVDYTLGE